MAYLTPASFRPASYDEACAQLILSDDEASDARLAATIGRLSERIDHYTNDHFESEALTIRVDGTGASTLFLPRRTTALTSVKFVDRYGVLGAAEAVTAYRLRSSLYAAGTKRSGDLDWIDAVNGGTGFSVSPRYVWPGYPLSVEVVGAFGWATPPGDVKRALALLVYDHFKPIRKDLSRSVVWRTEDASFDAADTTPTGIPEADGIIAAYQYGGGVLVG